LSPKPGQTQSWSKQKIKRVLNPFRFLFKQLIVTSACHGSIQGSQTHQLVIFHLKNIYRAANRRKKGCAVNTSTLKAKWLFKNLVLIKKYTFLIIASIELETPGSLHRHLFKINNRVNSHFIAFYSNHSINYNVTLTQKCTANIVEVIIKQAASKTKLSL
jgi:hypothetical protein